MSHQRYPSLDPVKEPHSVSLKVLRLSRPSLVTQHPLSSPTLSNKQPDNRSAPAPASLAYRTNGDTNPDPFLLAPILNLPPSFGSAYVGETFSCTLCANNETGSDAAGEAAAGTGPKKSIKDVRIDAEMKTPGSDATVKLELAPSLGTSAKEGGGGDGSGGGVDLDSGRTLQKIVNFDLKEEGNHVLAVTVSYYEATETSGRTRTFRKLYQFICKGSLIVRTKVGDLGPSPLASPAGAGRRQRWVMEAQLENCSEDVMQLERVALQLEHGLRYDDCNWGASGSRRPVLHPGEIEQVCFVVEEDTKGAISETQDGRIVFGVLGIGWRSEMGNRGYLSTGRLGTRATR